MSEEMTREQAIEYFRNKTAFVGGKEKQACEIAILAISALSAKPSCKTCKHYTAGEYDGSCGSYICKDMSDWEGQA